MLQPDHSITVCALIKEVTKILAVDFWRVSLLKPEAEIQIMEDVELPFCLERVVEVGAHNLPIRHQT